jgi:hypothetical protein
VLRRWFLRDRGQAALSGAPAVRRWKTYSAQTGYVYQYVYLGRRKRAADIEYVFDVTPDRKHSFAVSVLLLDEAVEGWERENEFALRDNERHGIAKMALFQAFDERPRPDLMRTAVQVRRADLEAIAATLRILP